jgi:hypothetical protein
MCMCMWHIHIRRLVLSALQLSACYVLLTLQLLVLKALTVALELINILALTFKSPLVY